MVYLISYRQNKPFTANHTVITSLNVYSKRYIENWSSWNIENCDAYNGCQSAARGSCWGKNNYSEIAPYYRVNIFKNDTIDYFKNLDVKLLESNPKTTMESC